MKRIVLGTSNEEKVDDIIMSLEVYAPYLLGRGNKNVLTLSEVKATYNVEFPDAEEDGNTVEENCMSKLYFYKEQLANISELQGSMLISEDTGMFIKHLNWSPGVHTARFAGDHDWNKLNSKVMDLMYGVEDRAAFIKTAVGITIIGAGEDTTKMDSKMIYGRIADNIYEGNGYSFDKIFVMNSNDITIAEMSNKCRELRSCELPRGMCIESLMYNSDWMRRIHEYMKP